MYSQAIEVNGKSIQFESPKHLISTIMSMMPNLQYWSYDALKELYVGTVNLIVEFTILIRDELKGSDKTKATRFLNTFHNLFRYIPKKHYDLLNMIYESILSGNKLSTLYGFGLANRFGDELSGDPETSSIVDFDYDYDEKDKEGKSN